MHGSRYRSLAARTRPNWRWPTATLPNCEWLPATSRGHSTGPAALKVLDHQPDNTATTGVPRPGLEQPRLRRSHRREPRKDTGLLTASPQQARASDLHEHVARTYCNPTSRQLSGVSITRSVNTSTLGANTAWNVIWMPGPATSSAGTPAFRSADRRAQPDVPAAGPVAPNASPRPVRSTERRASAGTWSRNGRIASRAARISRPT